MLNELTKVGFKKVGEWYLSEEEPQLTINSEADSINILYSFVVNGQPKYVGKTVQMLKKRMYGYRKPKSSQMTNIRNNKNIKDALHQGKTVEVYAFPDTGLFHYGGYHLNLAAGLEDSIVSKISPEWNLVGK